MELNRRRIVQQIRVSRELFVIAAAGLALAACSGSNPQSTGAGGEISLGGSSSLTGGGNSTAGVPNSGGTSSNGGSTFSFGGTASGGASLAGGIAGVGGTNAAGGTIGVGGTSSAGAGQATGGAVATGGNLTVGGTSTNGGTKNTGGSNSTAGGANTGGSKATGGINSIGGTSATGGSNGPGGNSATGGAATGGVTGTGGTGNSGRVRTILPFDSDWLFFKGDAAGADQATFVDTSWRALNVPHDWSIEGPFDQNATTTGRGGYLPAGIGWYRKHFTLPQSLSGRKVYIEFDGVMANSNVYINGVNLGQRPYGYVGFRYDITSSVKFGTADNVISVKCDNTSQPASRWYTGAGIYRHVRVITTDPVHVDQWATFVTTPTATATSATVHVTTTVLNASTTAQSVSLQGIVSDPSGTALSPVTAPAQNIAAGATANFTFDVPVTNPKLWAFATPNMYQLMANVQVGGTTLDDDVTPFGIRNLSIDATTGMNLNGQNVKFKGICMHHDVSGLGAAVPMRAWQRRLAQLKVLGVNSIRTSHNPFAPEVLDLADRMGFLVLDEFFDVWTAHKYTDVGDYATYFNRVAPAVTGSPSAGTGATWWQTDLTNIVMRDRNHPSVALYSIGNEIHDSLATRTPLATSMVALCHKLDPSRLVTQALLQPATYGDITGATRTILDVFGANYHVADVITAMGMAPARAGLVTEANKTTSEWTTIMNTPGLTGEFLWTGVDYLGEADGLWPTVGSNFGLMDRMGTPRAIGYTYQRLWATTTTTAPATGTTATKVVLTADHTTLLTDLNDVSYIKATVADASNRVVTSSAAPVTFTITGPGTIVAVDSGSQTQETFRGNVRNAFEGLAFAIVQATGSGTITVTAASTGLTGSSVTVQSSAGTFAPCSGTCD
jgi:beta-galactosidase